MHACTGLLVEYLYLKKRKKDIQHLYVHGGPKK